MCLSALLFITHDTFTHARLQSSHRWHKAWEQWWKSSYWWKWFGEMNRIDSFSHQNLIFLSPQGPLHPHNRMKKQILVAGNFPKRPDQSRWNFQSFLWKMEFSLFWPCLEVILGHILATGARRSRKFFSKKNFSRQNDRPRTNFQSFPWKMEIFHLGLARRWFLATGAHCSRIWLLASHWHAHWHFCLLVFL